LIAWQVALHPRIIVICRASVGHVVGSVGGPHFHPVYPIFPSTISDANQVRQAGIARWAFNCEFNWQWTPEMQQFMLSKWLISWEMR